MFYLIGILSGLMLAVQNPYNSNFGKQLASPIAGGFMVYVLGTIEFLLLLLITRANVAGILSLGFGHGNIWLLGGVMGAAFITSIIILFPILGPINAVIYPTLGQIFSGLIYDWTGAFGSHQVPVKVIAIIGLVLLLAGVFLTSYEKSLPTNAPKANIWQIIWALIAGALSTTQGLFNGQLSAIVKNASGASFIAFLMGTVFLLIVVLITKSLHNSTLPTGLTSFTGWVASTLGAAYVLIMTILMPTLGAGLTIGLSLVGVMVGSALVEQFGLFGVIKKCVTIRKIIGILLFICGVVLTKM